MRQWHTSLRAQRVPCEQITWSAAGLAGQSNATTRLSPFCWTASSVVTQTGAVPLRRTASPMAPQCTAGAAASRRPAGSVAPRRPAGAAEPRVVRAAAAWRAPSPPAHPPYGRPTRLLARCPPQLASRNPLPRQVDANEASAAAASLADVSLVQPDSEGPGRAPRAAVRLYWPRQGLTAALSRIGKPGT